MEAAEQMCDVLSEPNMESTGVCLCVCEMYSLLSL